MKRKPFPDAEKYVFKEKFIARYSALTDWETFKDFSLSFLSKSIRVNTLKIAVNDLLARLTGQWHLEQIPWCPEGFLIEHKNERLDVGNTIEHALGYYYVQSAASMIPPIVLDPKPGDAVLDLAAAPGSKASQIGMYLDHQGLLVANDVSGARIAALGVNLTRMGIRNVVVTQYRGENFPLLQFDKVLLDAPCSGSGTIRKSPKTITWWNPKMIAHFSTIQKRLLLHAYGLVKTGGTIVYSTCSLEPEENEEVVDFLLGREPGATMMPIDLPLKRTPCVDAFEGKTYAPEVKNCLRLFPQDNDTEGFFVAKIRKGF